MEQVQDKPKGQVTGLAAPAGKSADNPSSGDGALRLREDIEKIRATALQAAATPLALNTNLTRATEMVLSIDFKRYDADRHREAAPGLMYEVFAFQHDLRDQIEHWHKAGLMSQQNQRACRNLLRMTRYAADMLGELWIGFDRLDETERTYRAFTGTHHNTLVPTRFATGEHLPFQSGDVILVRGQAHNSAAIARIGDIDSQFSHVGMVYIDKEGKHWVVESVIEEGAVIEPLVTLLSNHLGRAVCLRHRDPILAKNAATIIHDRVRRSLSPTGQHIPYDFTMRPDIGRKLFCSKLVRRAYKEASAHEYILPTFPTQLSMKNRDFVDRIGVEALETFAPGDMELEPAFDVVAEWQDYRITSNLRLQDMVMDKLFEWMEAYNYRFHETFKIKLISILGRASSYLSNDIKDMLESSFPKIPPNMSRKAIAVIAMLHETAEPLLDDLLKAEDNAIRQTGLPLHPRDAYLILEKKRESLGSEIGYLRIRDSR
ncbi:MAG: YiiX/YebB-like N1pC/P60 family cysteine hydrolase [Pseudomonadota bacterium]